MKKLIFSTVLYQTPKYDVEKVLLSLESLNLEFRKRKKDLIIDKFLIIDNSKISEFSKNYFNKEKFSFEIKFFKSKKNLGYGMGHNHNLLLEKADKDVFFVAINPDVYFSGKSIIGFFDFITSYDNKDISCAAPLLYLPNNQIQYSAKKNPTMMSLLISRFSLFKFIPILKRYLDDNQNKFFDYEKNCIQATFLSGCFLSFPSLVYKEINGFSSNYFLHFEDADIVRRCNLVGRTIHCPFGFATHIRGRGSHKSFFQQFHLSLSYVKYSKTWGFKLF